MPTFLLSRDKKNLSFASYVLLFLLSLIFFSPGLSSLPPVDRDEALFAQASKQMVETNDYIDIRFQENPRYRKPIGIYWLQAASVKIFNAQHLNEIWAYRIPSLVGASLAVVMTAAIGSLFFGPLPGFLAAFMMMGCLVLNVEARLAKTDAALLAAIMVAQHALAKAYLARDTLHYKKPTWTNALIFWTAQAAGFLIKGPIPLLVTATTVLTVWRFDRRKEKTIDSLRWLSALYPLPGLFYMVLLVAPWFIAIGSISQGQFLQVSAGGDLFAKIWQGQSHGLMPPGLHLLALPLVFFPASLFILLALPDIWRNWKDPRVLFCLGWIIPTWIVFEISLTKLPHYVLPTYPALAILAAKILQDGFPRLEKRRFRWVYPSVACLWFAVGVLLVGFMDGLPTFLGEETPILMIAAGGLFLGSQLGAFVFFKRKPLSTTLLLTAGIFVFLTTSFGFVLPRLTNLWPSYRAQQAIAQNQPCADRAPLIMAAFHEPSLIFLAGTTTKTFSDSALAAATLQQDSCAVALISNEEKDAFLAAFPDKEPPQIVEEIQGFNLGTEKLVSLTLYKNFSEPKGPTE